MGTPDFAVPTLAGILAAGHEVVAVYTQPPRPAGRGMAERKSPVHLLAERHGLPVLAPASLKTEAEARAFAAHRADVGSRRRLRPDPAAGRARGAARGLPQPARLGAAALARRRPHPARHHGRRRRDGGDRHAHGGGPRYGPRLPHGACADRSGHDGRRAARHPGREGRCADGARARRARAGQARLHAAAGRRRHLCREDRQGRDPHRLRQARPRGAQSRARAFAGARCLVRGRPRGTQASASSCCAPSSLRTPRAHRRAPCWTTPSPSPAAKGPCACWRCSARAGSRWPRRSSCAASRSARARRL